MLGGDGAGDVVSVKLTRELADELREWSAPAQVRVRAGSAGYELEVRSASASSWLREQARKLEHLAEQIEGAEREQRGD